MLSKWAQMSLDANPDMVRRWRQVHDLEDQQKVFCTPAACWSNAQAAGVIVCDTH